MAGAIRSILGVAAAVVVLASATAATAAIPKSCPSAATVSAALGTKVKAPTQSHSTYTLTCTYGTGALSPKVEFQVDTAATFAAGEKAASAALPVVKIQHLGKAAWAPKAGGSLYVFTGSYTVKIRSPFTSLAKLEALARKLV